MNTKTISSLLAGCATPLLAGCLLRLEPSPDNEENPFGAAGRSDVYGAYGGRVDPGSERVRERAPAPPLTTESDDAAINPGDRAVATPYPALIVLEPGVLGPLSSNDDSAPFGFHRQMQWLAGEGDALELTRAWLLEWESASTVGPGLAPVTPRPMLGRLLVEPWVAAGAPAEAHSAEPAVAASDAEQAAAYGPYDAEPAPVDEAPSTLPSWQASPFRLIAIVNRVDLASEACDGAAGEIRYIYGAFDRDGQPLDVTVILEVPYPSTRAAAEWARAWTELAAEPRGESITRALAALGRELLADSDPLRARLRSNEIAFADADNDAWEMREFRPIITAGGLSLAHAPLEFTPRADADPAELSAYVLEHAADIERTGKSLPETLRAGAALIDAPDFSWGVLGVSERLRRAFSLQTCNGCHGGDTAALPFRHIGLPRALGEPASLSRFLDDPEAPSDELRRRLDIVQALSATECAPSSDAPGYGG